MLCKSINVRNPPCNPVQSPELTTALNFTKGLKVLPKVVGFADPDLAHYVSASIKLPSHVDLSVGINSHLRTPHKQA
jgi:hypothetical protein